MRYLLAGGIGDCCWSLTKIRDINDKLAPGSPIECYVVNRGIGNKLEDRALPFLERFPFIVRHGCKNIKIYRLEGPLPYNHVQNGRVLYLPDFTTFPEDEIDYLLNPVSHLENGNRLEEWLPEYQIDWKIMNQFRFTESELAYGRKLKDIHGEYVCFYFGPEAANTVDGQNRGPIWTPKDWGILGKILQEEKQLRIVCVGADYDRSYWEGYIEPVFASLGLDYVDTLGDLPLPFTFQVLRYARFVVGYDSGINVIANYMGTPTVVWWRACGDSISPYFYFTKDEREVDAWVSPEMLNSGKHLGLIYGRQTAEQTAELILRRNW